MRPMSPAVRLPYDGRMSTPDPEPSPDPAPDPAPDLAPEPSPDAGRDGGVPAEPGERPPSSEPGAGRRLNRAPSHRYRAAAEAAPEAGSTQGGWRSAGSSRGPRPAGAVIGAVLVAIAGAVMLTLILGVLASTTGTFAVSGIASVAIGLLVANSAVPTRRDSDTGSSTPAREPGGLAAASLRRNQAIRLAMGIGIVMIVLAGLGVWLLARIEGGVLDPFTYLWTTFGFGLPVQAVVALIGSAWGAASGPIRWRE